MLHAPISQLETLTQALIGGGGVLLGVSYTFIYKLRVATLQMIRLHIKEESQTSASVLYVCLRLHALLSGGGLDTLTGHKWQLPLSSTIFPPPQSS